jgi:urea ABC transporter urea binding protein
LPLFARKPDKLLRQWLFIPELAESLAGAVMDAGLGPPSRKPRSRPEYKVAVSRRELPSEIRIGILQSLSGTMALSEAQLVNAAMLAVEEINQQGGVMGRPLRAIVEDGASDPMRFRERARKLVSEDRVTSIFGCWTSSSRKAVLPIVEQEDALLWYPMQYEGLEKSRHIVYTGSCLNQQIEPAIRWALKLKRNRAYTVGSDYVFPRTANRLIRALVEAGGGSVVGEAYEPLGNARFGEIAAEIAELEPDIIYNTVNGADNVALFEALSKAGIRARETPVMSFSVSEIELSRCTDSAQGHLACWSYFQSMDSPQNRDLVRRFRGRYGESEVLSDPVVTAYSQVHLWKDVVERAGSLETDAVLSHLSGSRMDLGGEVLEVVENNHVWRRAVIGEARGNQFDVVWRSSQPIAPLPWLGVDKTDFMSRDLILGALQALPEMAERSSVVPFSSAGLRTVSNAT